MSEYRIKELSERSGVSVRNIRVYQDRGLLAPPNIRGRIGWYSESHLIRLNLISRMLERGYTFNTISELLMAARKGLTVENVLQGEPKGGRWRSLRRAATITFGELRNLLGEEASDKNIALSERVGLLVKEGPKMYQIANPQMLEVAERLVKAGVDLTTILKTWEQVQQDIDDIADQFVSLLSDNYLAPEGEHLDIEESTIHEAAQLVAYIRPVAADIVSHAFSDAMDARISGALATVADQLAESDQFTEPGSPGQH